MTSAAPARHPPAPEAQSTGPAPGFWEALGPPIYLVSILPGVGVWQLTQATGADLAVLVAATVAVVLLQHGINLLNDVSDWRLGADAEKWTSWVRYHGQDLRKAVWHGALSFVAGGLLGLGLLLWTQRLWILLPAAPLVGLGYLYNSGRRPLSYTSAGEWVTGLCYGPGVVGGMWLLIGRPPDTALALAAVAFGSLAVSLLLSHQPPQIETDRAAGKHSFAVRFGAAQTVFAARALFGVFVVAWALAGVSAGTGLPALVALVAAAAWAGWRLRRVDLGPKRVLVSATTVIVVTAVAGFIEF